MSQYFTYSDLQGRLPIDALTSQPECKTCSKSTCYSTYDNVQGVSQSKHEYTASFALDASKKLPTEGHVCDVSMIGCLPASIQNNDPYNITVKTVSKCDPSNPSSYSVVLPVVDGLLDRNRKESHRYTSSKSFDNNARIAANTDIPSGPYVNYTLNIEQKHSLSSDKIHSLSSDKIHSKFSKSVTSSSPKVELKKSSNASVKLSVPNIKLSTQSAKSTQSTKSTLSTQSPKSTPSTQSPKSTKSSQSKKIPVVVPIGKNKKLIDNFF